MFIFSVAKIGLVGRASRSLGVRRAKTFAEDGPDEAVAALRTFALNDRETILDERDPTILTDTIPVHRLVREIAASRYSGQKPEAAHRALVDALTVVYPEVVFNDPETWPRRRTIC